MSNSSIIVGSMIVSMSVNATEFERGMNRAAQSAEVGADKIVRTGNKLRDSLQSVWGDKGIMSGLKKITLADDFIGQIGAIGIAFGGWSLAIDAAVVAMRGLVGLLDRAESNRVKAAMGGRLSFDEQRIKRGEEAKKIADEDISTMMRARQSFRELTHPKTKEQMLLGGFEDDFQAVANAAERKEKQAADILNNWSPAKLLDEAMRAQGLFPDKPLGGLLRGQEALFENKKRIAEENAGKEAGKRFIEFLATIRDARTVRGQLQGMIPARSALMGMFGGAGASESAPQQLGLRLAKSFADGLVAGASAAMNQMQAEVGGNAAGLAQDGIGGFINRYFKAQQDFARADPMLNFRRELEQIKRDEADGIINAGQANVLRGRARGSLDNALPMMQPAFAGLVRANSAEASKAILSSMLPKIKPEERPLEELVKNNDQQLAELERIGRNTEKPIVFNVVNFN